MSMKSTVTPRQLEILRYIRDSRNKTGCSPTMQEIGDFLKLTKVTVFEHVAALEKKGLLTRSAKHSARSLLISPDFQFEDENPAHLPMVGRIAAGAPIEAIEDTETLNLDEIFADAPGKTFVLKVVGDSMIDDHICDGDYVVCLKQNNAYNGQTVVALLDSGEATLKRLYREKDRIRLQPANASYDPIFVDSVNIQGIAIGVIRRF